MWRGRSQYLFRALVYCCILAGAIRAEEWGTMIFIPPPGWTRVPQGDALTFLRATKNPDVKLVLLPAQKLGGDFRTTFAAIVKSRLKKEDRVLQHSPPAPFASNTNAESLFQILVIQGAAGRETVQAYMGFHAGNRIHVVSFEASNHAVFERYRAVLKDFVSHLQFAGATSGQTEPGHASTQLRH
jgi:hypothetical protein